MVTKERGTENAAYVRLQNSRAAGVRTPQIVNRKWIACMNLFVLGTDVHLLANFYILLDTCGGNLIRRGACNVSFV